MTHSRQESGFINLHTIILFVLVVAVLSGIGYTVIAHNKNDKTVANTNNTQTANGKSSIDSHNTQANTLQRVDATAKGGGTVQVTLPATASSGASNNPSSTTNAGSGSSATVSPPVKPGPSPSPAPTTFLVTGTFTEAPTRPTCSPTIPCSAPIVNHTVNATRKCIGATACNATVLTTTTNAQGQFSFMLPTGSYTLTLSPSVGVNGQSWSFNEIGQPINLQLTAKTGIY